MQIKLSKFSQKNLSAIHNFYTNCVEWKLWDAPWEDWSYDEKYELSKRQVYKEYLAYFKSLGYKEIYTQTWSGNIPMIHLAKSIGFEEVNCFKYLRTVRGKKYDALTFKIIL